MITLVDEGPYWAQEASQPVGGLVRDAGLAVVSVTAAMIVLPAIVIEHAIRALFRRKYVGD
ncbi:hypothetical protein [Paenarthrobacter nitroguajacolicus]|uniref:hypothetical protein n=1 Tax=Paenarthrobacter nitroguajacolicus TaxID=211146 RepID=UPI0015BD53EC|nr:hypothetical protein [Paenarthrobacter nitroguajacolicus]